MTRHPHATRGIPKFRRGFTLIEVLLVTILSAVLMVGLWSLFGTYIRLFDSGPERTERAQLLRALKLQFTDDLQGVNQIALPTTRSGSRMTFGQTSTSTSPNSAGAVNVDSLLSSIDTSSQSPLPRSSRMTFGQTSTSTSSDSAAAADIDLLLSSTDASSQSPLPRFGIIGDSQSLRLFTLKPPEVGLDDSPPDDALTVEPGLSPTVGREFVAVTYTFSEPLDASPIEQEQPPGLLRREQLWIAPRSVPGIAAESDSLFGADSAEATADELLADDSATWVPEVRALKFRYFGDGVWQESWDSLQKRALPTAVEIVFELGEIPYEDEEQEEAEVLDEVDEIATDDELVDENSTLLEDPERRKRQNRFLIYLPAGPKSAPPSGFGPSTITAGAVQGGPP